MRHAMKYGLVVLCALCFCGALAACGEEKKTELSAPENFRMDDEILYWDEVDGATKYYVYLEGSGTYVSEPSFDTFGLITEKGTHPIEVIALGDEKSTMESEPAVYEYTVEYQGYMYRETGKGGYEITSDPDDPPQGLLLIPEEINGKPVTKIAETGFMNCTKITALIFPDSLDDFGISAFYGCTSLTRVKLSPYLTEIHDLMFACCTSLWDCELPALVEKISGGAFENCPSLKELYIPASATKLFNTSWEGNRLEHIEIAEENPVFYSEGNCIIRRADKELVVGCGASVIPDDVVSIGREAFRSMGITEMPIIPPSVTSIKSSAFAGNPMTSFVLPANVTEFGDTLFWDCDIENLSVADGNKMYYSKGNCILTREDNTVVLGCKNSIIPPEARAIGQRAFMDCKSLKEIEIPSNIEEIGDEAFYECQDLKEVAISSGVEEIGDYVFYGCKSLRHLYLAYGLKKMGKDVFSYCWSLDGIAIPESLAEITTDSFSNSFANLYMAWKSRPDGWPSFYSAGKEYGCTLAYDEEGYCYLVCTDKISYDEDVGHFKFCSLPDFGYFFKAPQRRGYTFAGWATEEGGEVVFETEFFSGIIEGLGYSQYAEFMCTLFDEDRTEAYQKLKDKTLYAVWVPNQES